ncbi:MAG: hypothetical protein JNM70_14630 [Anaerolineae bacterium]|nr:hypothetical protein [Anaerolineae bacterium]
MYERVDGHGLLDLRARRYSPALGQFPWLDPLEVFNRYATVNGNPVMRTDPSGMLILMSETGGVSAKPVVKTTPVNTRNYAPGAGSSSGTTSTKSTVNPALAADHPSKSSAQVQYAPGAGLSSGTTVTKPPVNPAYTIVRSVDRG